MFPPLSDLYKVLNWHYIDRDRQPGESVGIFSVLPKELADQFPPKQGHDNSPPHVTICYIGDIPLIWENKVVAVVEAVCSKFRPFTVRLGSPKKLINPKGEEVFYSPVKSKKLYDFHDYLKQTLLLNQIPVDSKFPEYKPHVTIEYVEQGCERKFADICPTGEWQIDSVWLWGGAEPHIVHLGKHR